MPTQISVPALLARVKKLEAENAELRNDTLTKMQWRIDDLQKDIDEIRERLDLY